MVTGNRDTATVQHLTADGANCAAVADWDIHYTNTVTVEGVAVGDVTVNDSTVGIVYVQTVTGVTAGLD